MCSECQKQFCPSSCPSAVPATGGCVDCGAEASLRSVEGLPFCRNCVSEMPLDELLRFCGFRNVFDLIDCIKYVTALPDPSGKK